MLYLVEDVVSILLGMVGRLWQVGHHDGRVLMSLCHLMQVDQYLRVAVGELDVLVKEHRCVAMGVEGQYVLMHLAHLAILCSLLDQPLEDGQSFVHAVGMTLHTHDSLMLCTLHRLNDAVS